MVGILLVTIIIVKNTRLGPMNHGDRFMNGIGFSTME